MIAPKLLTSWTIQISAATAPSAPMLPKLADPPGSSGGAASAAMLFCWLIRFWLRRGSGSAAYSRPSASRHALGHPLQLDRHRRTLDELARGGACPHLTCSHPYARHPNPPNSPPCRTAGHRHRNHRTPSRPARKTTPRCPRHTSAHAKHRNSHRTARGITPVPAG